LKLTNLPRDFLTKPLAHRGLHGGQIPENSRAAFVAAVDAGYAIELDLQLSAEGEAMVFHDYDMKRLTGAAGPIRLQNAADLADRHLSNGETVPTLAEILELVAGRVPLLIEIKDQDGALGANVGALEARTAELVNKARGPLAVMSFNPYAIYAMQRHAPDVPRGLVTSAFPKASWGMVPQSRLDDLAKIPDFIDCGACFISHNHRHLDMDRVCEIKDTSAPVLCWTIKNQNDETMARQVADNITFEGYLP